jgi:phosphoglycolate phosphatase
VAPARTVVFDFDGTLADTLAVGLAACNAVAPEFGLRTVAPDEVPGLMQLSTRDALRSLGVPLHRLPTIVRRVRQQMRSRLPEVSLFAGIHDALAELHRAGLGLGVLTSNSRANVGACLGRHAVLPWFDFIHSSSHLFGKHRALRRLLGGAGISEDRVVYVGDQDRDVEAARRCGVPVVAVGWGYQSAAQLRSQQPDCFAATPADLTRFLLGEDVRGAGS